MGFLCIFLFFLLCIYMHLQYKKITTYINILKYDIKDMQLKLAANEDKSNLKEDNKE